MKQIRSKVGEERLRALLREGDPAGASEPLAADEVQAMRRGMLGALRAARADERSAPWRLPVLAATALAGVAGVVLGVLAWRSVLDVKPVEPAPLVAVAPPAPSLPPGALEPPPATHAQAGAEARAPRSPQPPQARHPAGRRRPHPEASVRMAASGSSPAVVPVVREVQFSTPGGTRIVWVFASGQTPAQESPRPSRL